MLFSKCCHFSRGGYSAKYDEKIKHFGSTKRKSKKEIRVIVEVFRIIEVVYIELFASKPPPIFGESNDSSREERDLKREIL
jgi:hypothetical protein